MEQDAVRLTTAFIKILQGHDSPEQFRGKPVVLGRLDNGDFALALAEGKFDHKRAYTAVIDIPEDFYKLEMLDFLFAMSALIGARVYASLKAVKSSQNRSQKAKREAGKAGAKARWSVDS